MNEKWQQHLHTGLTQVGEGAFAEAIVELSQALVEAPDEHVAQCYAARGYAHLCKSDFDRATEDCNLAIENNPADGEAYAWRGSAFAGRRMWSEAIEDYVEAISLSPENEVEYREVLGAHLDEAIGDFTTTIRTGQAIADDLRGRGTAYMYRGDFGKAVRDFSQALQMEPKHGPTYHRRAECLFDLEQYEKAVADCVRAVKCDEKTSGVYFTRARALRRLGYFDKAVADFAKVIKRDPHYAVAYYERGLAQRSRGAREAAMADFSKAISLDAGYRNALLERAKLQGEMGNLAEAVNDLSTAIALNPDDIELLEARGGAYIEYGVAEEAMKDFDAVLAVNAVQASAYRGRGLALAHDGDYDSAIREFTKAIRLDSRYFEAYESRGDVYLGLQQQEEAIADFTKCLQIDPAHENSASVFHRRGIAQVGAKIFDAAADDFGEVIARNPYDADSHAWRASALAELGRYREAIDSVNRAMELQPARLEEYQPIGQAAAENAVPQLSQEIAGDPENSGLFCDRAIAHEFLNAGNEALADYNMAIQLAPEQRETYVRRGKILWRAGKFERAKYDFTRAIELGDERAVCFHHRGVCLARLGDLSAAMTDLNRAIEIDDGDARCWRDRAEVFAALGEHAKAEADFTKSIAINDQDSRAFFGRGYLHSMNRHYHAAVRDFSAAIRRDDQHAMAYHRRGEALVSIGKIPQAIHDFESAIRLDEELIAAYCSRGLAVAKAGKHQRAAIELTKAAARIKYDLRFALAFECRARVFYSMGQYQRAVRDYDLVIELQSPETNLSQAYYGRALALLQLAEDAQAEGCLRKAIEISPNHADARAVLKWLHGGRQGVLPQLRAPASVTPLVKPPVVLPPVEMKTPTDQWAVEPVWDQWLVKLEKGAELGPTGKAGLDRWCADGRLGPTSRVLRMDWDEWLLATDIYPDLALATHRTTNRPIPVQPAPLVPEYVEETASPTGDLSFEPVGGQQAIAEEESPPEIVL